MINRPTPVISRPNISARPSSRQPRCRPTAGSQSVWASTVWPANTAGAWPSSTASAAAVAAAATHAVSRRRPGVFCRPAQAQPSVPASSGNSTVRASGFMGAGGDQLGRPRPAG